MATLAPYSTYDYIALERDEDGIVLVRFHQNGGPLVFNMDAHAEWTRLWGEIAVDPDTRLVTITGTGDAFMPPRGPIPGGENRASVMSPLYWQRIMRECTDHIMKMLEVPVPMIAAVNGPARAHAELALLNDIVIATPDTVFQDLTHFPEQAIPADVQHVMMPALIGRIRAAYYLYTDQILDADTALRLGLVNEVVDREDLLPRARQIARWMLRQPDANLRYFRRILTHELRGKMHNMLELGLAVEGLAAMSADWTDWVVEEGGLPPLRSQVATARDND